ncbi:hypothetical protein [Gellertiella hungarica]|uniref:Uncharacterized protein n=1 Tax=Gellertiella hungarica TaxID=1572859 RepID=A0A7W6J489_9HYPH|nr:hypothetical protein [Gellertiella hungarica]MBB4064467.1 hypothetical protein [Gellertiella hungarica]
MLVHVRRDIADADAASRDIGQGRPLGDRREENLRRAARGLEVVGLVARPEDGAEGIFPDVGALALPGIGGFQLGAQRFRQREIAKIGRAPEEFRKRQPLARLHLQRALQDGERPFVMAGRIQHQPGIEEIAEIHADRGKPCGKGQCLVVSPRLAQQAADAMVDIHVVGHVGMEREKAGERLCRGTGGDVMHRRAQPDLPLAVRRQRHRIGKEPRGFAEIALLLVNGAGEKMGVEIAPLLLHQTAQRRQRDLVIAPLMLLHRLFQQSGHRLPFR